MKTDTPFNGTRLLFIVMIVIAGDVFSGIRYLQQDGLSEHYPMLQGDLASCINNAAVFTSLLTKPDRTTVAAAGTFIGIVAIGQLADNSLRHETLETRSDTFNKIIQPWEKYGGGLFPFALASALYTGGAVTRNTWMRETGRECYMSLAVATLFVTPMKYVFGRERPYANAGSLDFDLFSSSNLNHSFPSGHTTAAFAISSVLASRIRNPIAGMLLYGAAGMTGIQRVYSDNHWLSDVIAGAFIGTLSGTFITHASRSPETESGVPFSVVPVSAGGATGIGVECEW